MKVSVIIGVYKDLTALGLILEALRNQTYKNFQVIVAEDDDSPQTAEFLKEYKDLDILHMSQPDTGYNKIKIYNKSICRAKGEYLFFIDGDIIPYKNFIEYSLKIAKPKRILAGRRVNLDEKTSLLVRSGDMKTSDIEDNYLSFYFKKYKDREARAEQGIELNPDGFVYKLLSLRKRNSDILGCNFSCFKEDMISINGFDEAYHPDAAVSSDTDLTWRFKGIGCELYSSKNVANCFHLYHKLVRLKHDATNDILMFENNQKSKQYRCIDGLDKY